MGRTDQMKAEVLNKVFEGKTWYRVGRAKFSAGKQVVHVRFCSPASRNNPRYKFNINPNTLTADFELWICGDTQTYYLLPNKHIREMYEHPDAYVDKHHENIRIVSVHTDKHEVMYAAGGIALDLEGFFGATIGSISQSRQKVQKAAHADEGSPEVEDEIVESDALSGSRPIGPEVFEKAQREATRVGEVGERIVLDYEKQKLESLGRHDLAQRVCRVSLENIAAGYDILSFDSEGQEKFIEVKASKSYRLSYAITANELVTAERHGSAYWIYRVSNVDGDPSEIIEIQDPSSLVSVWKPMIKP